MFESSPSSPLFGMSSTPSTLFLWTLSNMRYDLQIMPLFVSVEWTCACMCVCVCEYFSSVVQKSRWSCYPLGKHAYFITSEALFISIIWLSGCCPLWDHSMWVFVSVSMCSLHVCSDWGQTRYFMYIIWLLHVCAKLNEKECNTYVLVFSTIRKSILLRILIKDTKIHA